MAQSALVGTVTDLQDHRVPDAEVKATNTTTGLQRSTRATSQGDYASSNLPVGSYVAVITKQGFSDYKADRVQAIVRHLRIFECPLGMLAAGGTQQTTMTEPLIQLDKSSASFCVALNRSRFANCPSMGEIGLA